MRKSHEQIEGLLNQRPGTDALGEGFGQRVSDGISGIEPGANPVAAAVMPASVKGAIMLCAVGVISAGVWVTTSLSPAEEPLFVDNGSQTEDADGSILKSIQDALVNNVQKAEPMNEGRRMLDDAKRVGNAFVSVFPENWTEMIWSPGVQTKDSDAING